MPLTSLEAWGRKSTKESRSVVIYEVTSGLNTWIQEPWYQEFSTYWSNQEDIFTYTRNAIVKYRSCPDFNRGAILWDLRNSHSKIYDFSRSHFGFLEVKWGSWDTTFETRDHPQNIVLTHIILTSLSSVVTADCSSALSVKSLFLAYRLHENLP